MKTISKAYVVQSWGGRAWFFCCESDTKKIGIKSVKKYKARWPAYEFRLVLRTTTVTERVVRV